MVLSGTQDKQRTHKQLTIPKHVNSHVLSGQWHSTKTSVCKLLNGMFVLDLVILLVLWTICYVKYLIQDSTK